MTPLRFTTRIILAVIVAMAWIHTARAQIVPLQNVRISGTSQVSSGTFTIMSGASLISAAGSTVNLAAGTVTLPADVTRLGSSIDLASEVTGTLGGASISISGLTADASPDGAADYVVTYKASAAANRKVLLNDLPGGGGTWGTITGTLSNQTDLQTALDARQPLNSNLTAIAALTTTAFGRGLLDDADAAAARTTIGLGNVVNLDTSNASNISSGTLAAARIDSAMATDAEVTALFVPAGSSTQVQYNASGAFAGDAGMTYDAATDTLTLAGNLHAEDIAIEDSDASHRLTITTTSNLTAARTLTLVPGDAARTLTLTGDPTLADWFDQDVKTSAQPAFTSLKLKDNNAAGPQLLEMRVLSDLTADRALYIAPGDSQRTITLSGNPTLADWFDQDVKTTASPKFDTLYLEELSGGGTQTLRIRATSDLTANRILNLATPDADTTVTISGAASISGTNTGDQSLFSTIAVSGQSDVVADASSDTLTLVAGTNVTITTNATNDTVTIAAAGGAGEFTKELPLVAPVSGEDIGWFRTQNAITVTKVHSVSVGASPSLTFTIRHSTDRSAAGNEVNTGGWTTTSTTTGDSQTTGFEDATIPANSWVWVETTAESGTTLETIITLEYTVD